MFMNAGMKMEKPRWDRYSAYVLSKLSGAGFSLFVFFAMFVLTKLDMYTYSEQFANAAYWKVFFGYGIACSVIIDLITIKLRRLKVLLRILLHAIAGNLFFLGMEVSMSSLLFGMFGSFFALFFFWGTYAFPFKRGRKFAPYLFSLVIPSVLLLIANIDFTTKNKWVEKRTANTYTAAFDYFHGKHEIPIQVNRGDKITLSIHVRNKNGGGHGFHIKDERGNHVGMEPDGDSSVKLHAQKSEIYDVTVTGAKLQGGFTLAWRIDSRP
ncbi:hypothetical protein PAALTS15_01512 [Paenibacillus alvei TS-15]|uniref:Uncharacterized protein n=1 Tax=Paenibacillus alvei TS-15 TaxID=1117108 RepID=S9STJ8_PAEAL|nr:hypothetical protein [Paenibacillus alvei]EPY09062.1 hypothetical protein PAALTS15_01512 [Paenibacillus alvei TS-15]